MHLQLDKYRVAADARRLQRNVALVAGGLLLAVAVSCGVMVSMPFTRSAPVDLGAAGFCFVVGCLLPLAGGLLAFVSARREATALERLERLAQALQREPGLSHEALAARLPFEPRHTERLLLEAASLGVIVETPSPPPFVAMPATPPLVSPQPTAPPTPTPHPATPMPRSAPAAQPTPTPAASTPRTHAASPRAKASDPPPGTASASLLGRTLNDRYQIESPLGAGGMGAVFVARHVRTGRRYAVKTLLPDLQLSTDAIRRFEREAIAATAIGHPGIIAVHDYDVTPDGVHFLAMDLLEGETLERRLGRTGPMPWSEARGLVLELGDALAAAHEHGLLHRDLKPANVFLVPRAAPLGAPAALPPRVVLLDFGLVKRRDETAVSRLTLTGQVLGTPVYMSPEQALGAPVDARSDLYALATVLFEMVTGAPPFMDKSFAGVLARMVSESAPRLSMTGAPNLPAHVDAAVDRALARNPAERFADVRSFLAALR